TAPVIQSGGGEGTWVVSFVMPSRYTLASLPEPADERIRFRVVPSALVAAWKYRGGWSEERFADEEKAFRAALENAKLSPLRPPAWARYNAPFWPSPLRRNEILVEVRP
ncbi:MAG: heme-binding protein, partial [Acidobacteria bacterium]|nr:heme-binding protein [Acidobacteriota bacterium]